MFNVSLNNLRYTQLLSIVREYLKKTSLIHLATILYPNYLLRVPLYLIKRSVLGLHSILFGPFFYWRLNIFRYFIAKLIPLIHVDARVPNTIQNGLPGESRAIKVKGHKICSTYLLNFFIYHPSWIINTFSDRKPSYWPRLLLIKPTFFKRFS